MFKLKGILSALLLCFAGLAGHGQDSPLKVEIKSAQAKVNNYEAFSVSTVIRNTGTEEQLLKAWSCSYPTQWVSDVPTVRLNLVSCKKNDLMEIHLKPGETFERVLSVRTELSAGDGKAEPVTFRLGIKSPTSVIGQENLPNWSNPVTVNVTK